MPSASSTSSAYDIVVAADLGADFLGSGTQIIQGAAWRFIVCDLASVTITNLDRLAHNKRVVVRRNSFAEHSGTVPSDSPEINLLHTDGRPFFDEDRLVYGFRREGGVPEPGAVWRCRYAGKTLNATDQASDSPETPYVSYDSWLQLGFRPALKNDIDGIPTGEWIGPNGFNFVADMPGSDIALQMLYNSISAGDVNGVCHIDLPVAYGGTGLWEGVIEETEPPVGGPFGRYNVPQGSTVMDVWNDLVMTGTMDIVLTPVYDPVFRPGILADLSILVKSGQPRPGAVMAWDKPGRSLTGVSRQIDGAQRANVVRFHPGQEGPRSVTVEDASSIATHGRYVLQQFFPDQKTVGQVTDMAQRTLELRADGLKTITMNPAAERSPSPLLEYTVGDEVPVSFSRNLREATEEYWRVEEIPIDISDDGVETVSGLAVSRERVGETT